MRKLCESSLMISVISEVSVLCISRYNHFLHFRILSHIARSCAQVHDYRILGKN